MIALTSQWQKFVITVDLPSIAGKIIGTNGDDYLAVQFYLDAGVTIATALPGMGQQNIVFDLARVQCAEGAADTPCEPRHIQTELALCQRYFCKTFPLNVAPAQNTGFIGVVSGRQVTAGSAGATNSLTWTYPVRMRAAPAIVTYNPQAANGQVRNLDQNVDCSGTGIAMTNDWMTLFNYLGSASSVASSANGVHATADAEL
ncbi:hypothetical protein OL229_04350 [Neisseriaceae bacterium JH1-16]|nr:hypothetical protein [Neisseriaceae bacterium JH1-16]